MLLVYYAFLIVGLLLLLADLTGRLRVSPKRVRWWRWIAVAAAAGPGLAPLLWCSIYHACGGPFPLIQSAYLVAFGAFAVGALVPYRPESVVLRRAGYVGLLLLAALPSWVLLVLTPFVALAGIGLAREAAPRSSGTVKERG